MKISLDRKDKILISALLLIAVPNLLYQAVYVERVTIDWPSLTPTPESPDEVNQDEQVSKIEQSRVTKSARYLEEHFDEELGLIFESDEGYRDVDSTRCSFNRTFWLYSDNLLAGKALKFHNKTISQSILTTVERYTSKGSGLYEVLFGEPIPEQTPIGVSYVVEKTDDHVIMVEIHDSSTLLAENHYGDIMLYQALNAFIQGDRDTALQNYYAVYEMWDGKGINDLASQTDGFYANYKLALFIYTTQVFYGKILDHFLPAYNDILSQLLKMQRDDGGVVSLADSEGQPMGSANTETTALFTIAFNSKLIRNLQDIAAGLSPRETFKSFSADYPAWLFLSSSVTNKVDEVELRLPLTMVISNDVIWLGPADDNPRAVIGIWQDMPTSPHPSVQIVMYGNKALDVVTHTALHPGGIKIGGIRGWVNPIRVTMTDDRLFISNGDGRVIVDQKIDSKEFIPFRVRHVTAGSSQLNIPIWGSVKVEINESA